MNVNKDQVDIVLFNMSSYREWQKGVSNRNYHVFRNLLINEKVGRILIIDYLPHTFRRVIRNYWENIFLKKDYPVRFKSLGSKVYQVDDKLWVYSTVRNKFSKKKFYDELNKILQKLVFKNYLVWSFYPLEVGYFDKLQADFFIFDTVDNWSEHPSYLKFKNRLLENYKIIDQKADLIFTVSEELQSLYTRQDKVHWLPNGVDLKHFQKEFSIINRDIGEISRPIIGYVGVIQSRMDLDLLEFLAKSNPNKSFVLIGPVWHRFIKSRFKSYANVYFLGKKSYEDEPMYMAQFDVGIVPHKIDKFHNSTNPMKIYGYLACGKPVVCTVTSAAKLFEDLIYATNDFQEFNKYLNQSLAEDSDKLRERRLAVIKEHSWLKRTERMLELIFNRL